MQFDEQKLASIMSDIGAVYEKTYTTQQIGVWYGVLSKHEYTWEQVIAGFQAHMDTPDGKFAPKPAHIVEQIEKASPNVGHVTSDEAWAIALNGVHESETICTTAEILEALELARPIMAEGDKVGARMAFKGAYERIVKDANRHGKAPKWFLSLGTDKVRRLDAAEAAVAQGRIGRSEIQHLLPEPDANPAMLRLVGKVLAHPAADEGKARLAITEMRQSLGIEKTARDTADRSTDTEAERERQLEALAAKLKSG